MTVLVWSELPEPNADHLAHDCAYSAAGMALIHGGFTHFPLGAYTVKEREALEGSDTRPDEEGGTSLDVDLAVLTRYDLHLHAPNVMDSVKELLLQPGLCVSIGGIPADAPSGSPIRKHTSTTKGHRLAIRTTGTSTMKLGDPLAPNQSAFIDCPLADVLAFSKGRTADDLRYTIQNEYGSQAGTGGLEVGFPTYLITPIVAGTVAARKGIDTFRLVDSLKEPLGADISRDGVAAIHIGGSRGYLVNLSGSDGKVETCWVRGSDVTFTKGVL